MAALDGWQSEDVGSNDSCAVQATAGNTPMVSMVSTDRCVDCSQIAGIGDMTK